VVTHVSLLAYAGTLLAIAARMENLETITFELLTNVVGGAQTAAAMTSQNLPMQTQSVSQSAPGSGGAASRQTGTGSYSSMPRR
jgi:hypothetical protein